MVFRWNGDVEQPVLLDGAYNLRDYGYFKSGLCVCARGA